MAGESLQFTDISNYYLTDSIWSHRVATTIGYPSKSETTLNLYILAYSFGLNTILAYSIIGGNITAEVEVYRANNGEWTLAGSNYSFPVNDSYQGTIGANVNGSPTLKVFSADTVLWRVKLYCSRFPLDAAFTSFGTSTYTGDHSAGDVLYRYKMKKENVHSYYGSSLHNNGALGSWYGSYGTSVDIPGAICKRHKGILITKEQLTDGEIIAGASNGR